VASLSLGKIPRAVGLLDSFIFSTFFVAVAMPFPQVMLMPAGGVTFTGFELVYGVATGLLILKVVLAGKIRSAHIAFFVFSIFAVYVVGSAAIGEVTFGDALRQARFYWPFLLAVLLLVAGSNADFEKFFRYTVWATIISSGSALILHHWFPLLVQRMLAAAPEAASIIERGRLNWMNVPLTLFMLLFYSIRSRYWRINGCVAMIALVLSAVATFNTLNRTMMAGVAVLLTGTTFLAKGGPSRARSVVRLLAISLLFAAVVVTLMVADSRVEELVARRYAANGEGTEQIYQHDIEQSRMFEYRDYVNSVSSYFPWGQGLGRPYSKSTGIDLATSDISLMSFLLPFGFCGVLMYGAFVWALWRTIGHDWANLPLQWSRGVKLLIVVSLFMSLNMDLYSHNNFVVLLTFLVLCLCKKETNRPAVGPLLNHDRHLDRELELKAAT
jgi:hypothetical protein